ncbi:hypothetical protein ACVO5P_000660 [Campylobacter coli]
MKKIIFLLCLCISFVFALALFLLSKFISCMAMAAMRITDFYQV